MYAVRKYLINMHITCARFQGIHAKSAHYKSMCQHHIVGLHVGVYVRCVQINIILPIRWSCIRTSSPATGHIMYVMHCWLINPNMLNLLSWLLAYLSNKSSELIAPTF